MSSPGDKTRSNILAVIVAGILLLGSLGVTALLVSPFAESAAQTRHRAAALAEAISRIRVGDPAHEVNSVLAGLQLESTDDIGLSGRRVIASEDTRVHIADDEVVALIPDIYQHLLAEINEGETTEAVLALVDDAKVQYVNGMRSDHDPMISYAGRQAYITIRFESGRVSSISTQAYSR